ncbi:Asp23/Gls24 family envelope stress response protein, partial [Streptomyces daliensis]|nr:Asp23/Gls24 family envelope stress response protein [Streptomyces daliensis]
DEADGTDGTGARGRAVVRRGRAVVTVRLALPYPADLAALCAAVRRHVAARTALLTGIPVASVRVRVDRLVPEERSARRVR